MHGEIEGEKKSLGNLPGATYLLTCSYCYSCLLLPLFSIFQLQLFSSMVLLYMFAIEYPGIYTHTQTYIHAHIYIYIYMYRVPVASPL